MFSSSLAYFSFSASTNVLKNRSNGTYTVDGFSAVQSAKRILESFWAKFHTFALTRLCLADTLSLPDIEVIRETHALIRRDIDSLCELLDVEIHLLVDIRAIWVVYEH